MWRCIKPWDPDVYVQMGVRFREQSRHQHPFYQEYLYSKLYSRCKSDKPTHQMEARKNKPQSGKPWFRWWDLCSIMLPAKDSPRGRFSLWTQKTNVGKIGGCWTPSSIEGADHCWWHNSKNTNYPWYMSEAH